MAAVSQPIPALSSGCPCTQVAKEEGVIAKKGLCHLYNS